MNTYYLRMEGVNLSNFVYDTQDLSTIRGGGLLLLHAVAELKKQIPELQDISTGASSGLFSFEAADDDQARAVRDSAARYFGEHGDYRHATMVIDTIRDSGDFNTDQETLIALNRWRQMQSPSIAVPDMGILYNGPCAIDLVRPAVSQESESVRRRREYGRKQKQIFYRQETGLADLPAFVSDLGSLSGDRSQGNLNNKLAVIYLDGNGFGKIQSSCKNQEELKQFDIAIKVKRKAFLQHLFTKKILCEEGWRTENGEIRFEIMLWGGDEMILVVPAWKGWETLDFFYQYSREWSHGGEALHHGGGLVFCHHKAHIHRITALAKELAELAKHDRWQSLFVYKALESFDHIGQSAEDYLGSWAEKTTGRNDFRPFVLNGNSMEAISDKISTLKRSEFPRGKIYKYLKQLHSGDNDGAVTTIKKAVDSSLSGDTVTELSALLQGETMQWLHIAELWDYIPVHLPQTERT